MKRVILKRGIFFLPFLILISIYYVYPVLDTFRLTFYSPEGEFVGLENYFQVLGDPDTVNLEGFPKTPPLGSLMHNAKFVAIHLPLSTVLGLLFAVLFREVWGGTILKTLIFVGMVMPLIVGGILIRFMFDKGAGVVPLFFSFLGVENLVKTWTAHPETALLAIILGSVWIWVGFSMTVYSAGLAGIPKDYYEAAKIDGASPLRIFFRITVPLLRPVTAIIVFMTIMWELKMFDLVYVATFGGPGGASNVLAFQAWLYAFRFMNFNLAAVVATLLTGLILVVTILVLKYGIMRR